MAMTSTQAIEARRRMVIAAFPGGAPVTVTKAQIDAALAAVTAWFESTGAAGAVGSMSGTVLQGATSTIQAQAVAIVAECRYGGVA